MLSKRCAARGKARPAGYMVSAFLFPVQAFNLLNVFANAGCETERPCETRPWSGWSGVHWGAAKPWAGGGGGGGVEQAWQGPQDIGDQFWVRKLDG